MKTLGKYLGFLPCSIPAVAIPLLILFLATPGFSTLFSYGTPPLEESASPQPEPAEPAYSSADKKEFVGFNEEIPGVGAFFNEMLDR